MQGVKEMERLFELQEDPCIFSKNQSPFDDTPALRIPKTRPAA